MSGSDDFVLVQEFHFSLNIGSQAIKGPLKTTATVSIVMQIMVKVSWGGRAYKMHLSTDYVSLKIT